MRTQFLCNAARQNTKPFHHHTAHKDCSLYKKQQRKKKRDIPDSRPITGKENVRLKAFKCLIVGVFLVYIATSAEAEERATRTTTDHNKQGEKVVLPFCILCGDSFLASQVFQWFSQGLPCLEACK